MNARTANPYLITSIQQIKPSVRKQFRTPARAWLVAVVAVAAGLTLPAGSQANTRRHRLQCGPGYVRRSDRVPERRHGRIVRRHGKIVYTRVQRCAKVDKPKTPIAIPPQPIPGSSSNPVATSTADTPSTTTTTPSPAPSAPTGSPCPTAIPGDTLQLGRTYTREGEDTFAKDAPVGSFAQSDVHDASLLKPIYTGDHGMGWSAYPDGWPSTYTAIDVDGSPLATPLEGYQPSTVLSVHDGVLDFYLHDDAIGNPVGADVSPWPAGNEYQTYGAYSFCEKVAPTSYNDLSDFYEASLLWPQNQDDGPCAESDFPETYASPTNAVLNGGSLDNDQVYAFAHYGTWSAQSGCPKFLPAPDSANTPIDLSQWHVFTQEWGPGYRSYYIDGKYVYTSTSQVWSQPERWQLQMEPSPSSQVQKHGGTGHVYIAWVWIGKPDY